MINIFKHLLPRARATNITIDKQLRQLFAGLVPDFENARDWFNTIWLDLFPQETNHLYQWERVFGIPVTSTLTDEQERRDRLDALWKAQGGQDPSYIQETLQAAGFDVYLHEWWVTPITDPPVAHDPFFVLGQIVYACGDPLMQCGEPTAQCGNSPGSEGYFLVNKLYTAIINYTVTCGEPLAQCGEPTALCGENDGISFVRKEYPTPTNPTLWPFIIYVGGAVLGDQASIPFGRKDEFEDLCLKLFPAHLWICLLISYESTVIEDATLNTIIEDTTGNTVVVEM